MSSGRSVAGSHRTNKCSIYNRKIFLESYYETAMCGKDLALEDRIINKKQYIDQKLKYGRPQK